MTPVREVQAGEAFDVRQAIRDVLAEHRSPDPREIASDVVSLLPTGAIDALVVRAVYELTRDEIRASRTIHAGNPGVSRWQRHRISIDGLGDRISVAGTWMFVADCTAEHLDVFAAEQRARAQSIEANAQVAAGLAERLRAAGVETVADLYAAAERQAA